jgi:hypothetical protein
VVYTREKYFFKNETNVSKMKCLYADCINGALWIFSLSIFDLTAASLCIGEMKHASLLVMLKKTL